MHWLQHRRVKWVKMVEKRWKELGSNLIFLVCWLESQTERRDLQDELHRKFTVADFLECVCLPRRCCGSKRGTSSHSGVTCVNQIYFSSLCFFFNCISFDLICDVNKTKAKELTPPQLSVLARSFPVPRGRTATGGWGFICSSSRVDRIQPTYRETLKLSTEFV